MLVSTQTEKIGHVTDDFNAVKIICEAGYDAIDYSMFDMKDDSFLLNTPSYKAHVTELKKLAESYGKFFNQAHAPFPSMREDDEEYNKKTFERITRSVEICGIMDIGTLIVHPVAFDNEQLERNIEFYKRLEPYCKEYGVKVALENMWGWDKETHKICPNVCSTAKDFPVYVDALDPRYFTACLDIGHSGLVGDNAPDMITALGHDRLTCLHVHDNDFKDDSHMPPFTMKIDWKAVAAALKEIDYSGIITLEADNFLHNMPRELFLQAESFMCLLAKRLASMAEGET